jgi:hypothetical protein
MIHDPEARRDDTSIPNMPWSETPFVHISLNAQKTGNGVPRMLASNVRKRPANSILFVGTAFSLEFSSFSDGPAVLGV